MPALVPLCLRVLAAGLLALLLSHCAHPARRPLHPALRMAPDLTQWTARDGKTLPFKFWTGAPPRPRAVVICVHGLSGAASDFWPVGESFPVKGYAVYGMQLRGQGHDPDVKRRGDIRSSMQWRADLLDFTALVRQRHPGVPVYWFGESLGALIIIDAVASLPAGQKTVAGIMLTTPVVALRGNLKLGFWKNLAVRTLLRIIPGKRTSLEGLGNSEVQVTSKTTHREQMQHTEHYVKNFTLRLFGQIERLIRQSNAAAGRIHVPVLVLYTPNDVLTSKEGVEQFYAAVASRDKNRVFFPESYHLILHDKDRSEALQRLENWLGQHAASPDSRNAQTTAGIDRGADLP
jgi:acylglycerol lipase